MQENKQPIEKVVIDRGETLDVIKVWKTIQGEGPWAGMPAVFVRLAGCNLQCRLCDTQYTDGRISLGAMTLAERVERVAAEGHVGSKLLEYTGRDVPIVVISGGEPLRQNIAPLVKRLLDRDFIVQIETNGTLFNSELPYGNYNLWIVCSPKTPFLHPALQEHIHALKYVLQAGQVDERDGLPLHTLGSGIGVARPNMKRKSDDEFGFLGEVYVEPLDEQDVEKNRANLDAAVRSSMKFGYRLSLQLHKIIGLE